VMASNQRRPGPYCALPGLSQSGSGWYLSSCMEDPLHLPLQRKTNYRTQ
jgi:hypothetical protein